MDQRVDQRTDRSTEKSLLLRSHDEQKTDELLRNRYSLEGDQKPFLVLTGTKRAVLNSKESKNDRKPRSKTRKSPRHNAKDALRTYIQSSKKAEKDYVHQLRIAGTGGSTEESTEGSQEGIPQYEQFLALNQLWNSYIQGLLYSDSSSPSSPSSLAMAGKLASADFHGARLKVSSCTNPSMVGIEGIVVWEAQSSFIMVIPKGGLRIIGKKGTRFQFSVQRPDSDQTSCFEIIGSRFLYRTADRSGRKFKPRSVNDL